MSCASCHVRRVPSRTACRWRWGAAAASATRDAAGCRAAPLVGWDGAPIPCGRPAGAAVAAGEMGQRTQTLAATVRRDPLLAAAIALPRRSAGADDERVHDLGKALAAYQATLLSPAHALRRFPRRAATRRRRRSGALSRSCAARPRLFIGAARCSVCHVGAAFSNGEFAESACFLRAGGVDPGRHGGCTSCWPAA